MSVLTALLTVASLSAIIFPQFTSLFTSNRIPKYTRPITLTSSPIASPSPTISLKPNPAPFVKPTSLPSTSPNPVTSPPATTYEIKKDYIMQAINDFRKSKGLKTSQTDSYTCNFAALRVKEISTNFNHDGFRQRIDSKTLPYPSYSQITENISMTSDYKQVIILWINSSGHNANMQKDTPYVCVESFGNYYAYEGWKP